MDLKNNINCKQDRKILIFLEIIISKMILLIFNYTVNILKVIIYLKYIPEIKELI